MDGTTIVALIDLFGDDRKEDYEQFRLSVEGATATWKYVSLDQSKPFHTSKVYFNNLTENQIYEVFAQYQLEGVWHDIPSALIATSNYLMRTVPKNFLLKTFSHEENTNSEKGINIAMQLRPVKASIARTLRAAPGEGAPGEGPGEGPGEEPGGGEDANIALEYLIPQRPTQQTQNVYDKNGYYQGQAGSCVANAIASAKEIQESRHSKTLVNYSISWFFGKNGKDNEINYIKALSALKEFGIPPVEAVTRLDGKTYYPDVEFLNESKEVYQQSGALYNFSKPQKISDYAIIVADQTKNAAVVEEICDAIKNTGRDSNNSTVVIVTITIDSSFDLAGNNGVVGDFKGGDQRGGHCMVVIGWATKNGKKYWVVQNSWTSWYTNSSIHMNDSFPSGNNGLYYIPFDWYEVKNGFIYGLCEFYILYDDPNAPSLPYVPSYAYLVIDEITTNSIKWTIHRLSKNFNRDNYRRAGITSSQFTAASNGVASISDIVDYKDASYSSKVKERSVSGTVRLLTPNTSYTFWGFTQAANQNYYATDFKGGITFKTLKAEKPALWAWENPKRSGIDFNLTSSEWKHFCSKINEVRAIYGYGAYGFTTDSSNIASGRPFAAWIFKQAATAISQIQNNAHGVDSRCLNVTTGDTIYAWYFTNLETALNNAIDALN